MIQSLKGMPDLLPGETETWQEMEAKIRSLLHGFGYGEIRTPFLERTELFTRSIGNATDVVQKEMYTIEREDGESFSLRPEGTASIVRAYIENHLGQKADLWKLYYLGPMFRHERPQKGRLRQFHQIGIEAIGSSDPMIDVEIIQIGKTLLDDFSVKNVALELNSVGDSSCRPAYQEHLIAYLKKNASALSLHARDRIEMNPLRVLDSKAPEDREIIQNAPVLKDYLCDSCREHLDSVCEGLSTLGISYSFNPYIVRGLDYYTKTAFEFTAGNLGAQNTICGGGRYDTLIEELGGSPTPAMGFGLGLERLLLSSDLQLEGNPPRVEVYPLDPMARWSSIELAHEVRNSLRKDHVPATVFVSPVRPSMKSALRQANKKNARIAILLNAENTNKKEALLKDLKTSEQMELSFSNVSTWIRDRIKK